MTKIKTSELTGAALDWVVAKLEGHKTGNLFKFDHTEKLSCHNYSTNWSQGGPIIERELITVCALTPDRFVAGYGMADSARNNQTGPTYLISAMRCYVASKLGDEVEIPEELT